MIDKRYKRIVNIIGWIIFSLTTLLYIFTMYPTVSFWDSGEFIFSSYQLSVNHQPGAPLYQLIACLFSKLAFGEQHVAAAVNLVSALSGGISIMLLYHLFLYLFNKYSDKPVGNVAAAVISALTFAFTDSFWTSSTEAEVYSLSFLFTTLCLHLIISWEENPKEKYIILLCFILGLSYGVHPLTLLIIPAIVFIIFFHYHTITVKGLIYASCISVLMILVFTNALKWILSLYSLSTLWTNVIAIVIIGLLLFLSYYKKLPLLNSIVFCVLFFFVGTSTYVVTSIRSKQDIPCNEYPAYNSKALNNYISRTSYIKAPIVYGQYFTALPAEDFKIKNNRIEPVFSSKQKTFFPRMWNYTSAAYEDGYVSWVGMPKNTVNINGEERQKPSFLQNLQFFSSYQFVYMYVRYLLWNFCGKSNDMQGYGDLSCGVAQSGYYYTDRLFNVSEGRQPWLSDNKANNRYFAIPLILCLIGVFYHIIKDSKRFLFVGTIFVMYSLAIVIYTNMTAYEPRERDYIYLPSFMAISIWIGIGILGISQIIANIIRVKKPRYILPIFLIVPIWMFIQNIDDHNHRHQYSCRNFAYSLLSSCQKNAILFVDGDNDTYPLWYLQNVEHIRQDVRVINREFLNNPYYLKLLTKAMPENKPLKLSLNSSDYEEGIMDEVQILPSFDTIPLQKAIDLVRNDHPNDAKLKNHIKHLYFNTIKTTIDDKDIVFHLDKPSLSKADIMLLDIIASNNERPIYFSSYSNDSFLGLDNYLLLEGFNYRLTNNNLKEKIDDKTVYNSAIMNYNYFMHTFEYRNFKNNIYFNEIERNIIKLYFENATQTIYKLVQCSQEQKALILTDKILQEFPTDLHQYPYSWADFAIVYSLCDHQEKAQTLMDKATDMFLMYLNRYTTGTIRYQSENRLEAQKCIVNMINLCLTAEDYGLETMRRDVSEVIFSMIKPYIEITLRQRKIMLLQQDWYQQEIDNIDALLDYINNFAEHYEFKLARN